MKTALMGRNAVAVTVFAMAFHWSKVWLHRMSSKWRKSALWTWTVLRYWAVIMAVVFAFAMNTRMPAGLKKLCPNWNGIWLLANQLARFCPALSVTLFRDVATVQSASSAVASAFSGTNNSLL